MMENIAEEKKNKIMYVRDNCLVKYIVNRRNGIYHVNCVRTVKVHYSLDKSKFGWIFRICKDSAISLFYPS